MRLNTMDALSPSARWYSFRPRPGMHGCWSLPINLLPDSPAMEIQNPSTLRKPTLITPSPPGTYVQIFGSNMSANPKDCASFSDVHPDNGCELSEGCRGNFQNMFTKVFRDFDHQHPPPPHIPISKTVNGPQPSRGMGSCFSSLTKSAKASTTGSDLPTDPAVSRILKLEELTPLNTASLKSLSPINVRWSICTLEDANSLQSAPRPAAIKL